VLSKSILSFCAIAHAGASGCGDAATVYWSMCALGSRAVMDAATVQLKASGVDADPDFRGIPSDMRMISGRIAAHGLALSRGCGDRGSHLRMVLALASAANSLAIVQSEAI
jgi:hypothetical protein